MNNPKNTKVVIVDDSDFYRSVLREMLKVDGIQIVGEANNAESALMIIKEKNPDIVITDIVMPDISGLELTEKINSKFSNTSVIVISSLSQEHVILDAISSGASDFIAKPVQKEQLLDSVYKIINTK